MPVRIIIVGIFILMLCCCQKNEGQQPAQKPKSATLLPAAAPAPLPPAEPLSAPAFLSKPVETTIVETTAGALPVWRKFAKNRPMLAIVSQGPGLLPVPEELREQAAELLRDADDATLRLRSGTDDPDPVLLPPMSVGAALDAGWFSGLVWVFPSSASPETIDSDRFRQQLVEAGFAGSEEAQGLSFEAGVFRGSVRGKPFVAAPLAALPNLDQTALLHLDVDYFKALYKGEIKTPLHALIFDLLEGIKAKGWKVAAATVSHSNLGAELPLPTRFIGYELADVLHEPALLAGDLPPLWQARADALYLENFMQKDKMRDIYEKLVKEEPADASLRFALYHVYRQYHDKGGEALAALDQAVRIDPVYALEYLPLAELALQRKKPEKAVEMMRLLLAARPDDPFVLLHATRTLINAGATEQAKTLLPQLTRLQWSTTYYPQLAQETDGLIGLLKN